MFPIAGDANGHNLPCSDSKEWLTVQKVAFI